MKAYALLRSDHESGQADLCGVFMSPGAAMAAGVLYGENSGGFPDYGNPVNAWSSYAQNGFACDYWAQAAGATFYVMTAEVQAEATWAEAREAGRLLRFILRSIVRHGAAR
jgi:hypothetical protein